jgi:hypothetical protein
MKSGYENDNPRYLTYVFSLITVAVVLIFSYKPFSSIVMKYIHGKNWTEVTGTVVELEKYCIPNLITNGIRTRNRQLEPMNCREAQSIAQPSSEGSWIIIPTIKALVRVEYKGLSTDHYFFPTAIGRPFIIGEKLRMFVNSKDINKVDFPIIDRDVNAVVEGLSAALFMILVGAVVILVSRRK